MIKSNFLFPHKYRKIGWALLIPSLILGLYWLFAEEIAPDFLNVQVFSIFNESFFIGNNNADKGTFLFSFVENNIADELICLGVLIGGILVAFTKEKVEDELLNQIRLKSLVWATYVNYIVLFLSIVFVYGISFFTVLVINMFTILLFFIGRYYFEIYRMQKSVAYAE